MTPDKEHITISDNKSQIEKLIQELVLQPRIKAIEWSKVTEQTPSMKIGYPGQHLASLVVGMKGTKTGARGHDIVDGSEVKSCSRVDQSDTCRNCKEKLLRTEAVCPYCSSDDIARDNTSKWLFPIRSEADLSILTKEVPRVILVLADYPNFDNEDYNDIRFQVFEIWPNSKRCSAFTEILSDYYHNVYLWHKEKDNEQTPAPQNFWPYSFQFYKSNPIKVFSCYIKNASTAPEINIDHYIAPEADRNQLESEYMPTDLLGKNEIGLLIKEVPKELLKSAFKNEAAYAAFLEVTGKKYFRKKDIVEHLPLLNEELRNYLPIRGAKPFDID